MSEKRTPTILFVDRDDSVLWMYRELFDGCGTMIFATSLERAKELLVEQNIHLVVTSLELSDGDGLDLLKFVRARKSAIPFVLCTGKVQLPEIKDEKFFVVERPRSRQLREIVARCLSRFKRSNTASWSGRTARRGDSDVLLEDTLAKLPLCDLSHALSAIDDLDKLVLEKAESEGTPEELRTCLEEISERRRARWDFICGRILEDVQKNRLLLNRVAPFGKKLSQIS